jgi:ADP-ribose pyrophosphatase YjhB (NUDIX family)
MAKVSEHDTPSGEARLARSARLLVIDREQRLLLFRYHDGHRPPFWATAGGRLEPGESYEAAAARELREETGFVAPIGRLLRTRDQVFTVGESVPTRYIEHYYLVECEGGTPDRTHWTDQERTTIRDLRWWSLTEMQTTSETILPPWLPELLATTLRDLVSGERGEGR